MENCWLKISTTNMIRMSDVISFSIKQENDYGTIQVYYHNYHQQFVPQNEIIHSIRSVSITKRTKIKILKKELEELAKGTSKFIYYPSEKSDEIKDLSEKIDKLTEEIKYLPGGQFVQKTAPNFEEMAQNLS